MQQQHSEIIFEDFKFLLNDFMLKNLNHKSLDLQ